MEQLQSQSSGHWEQALLGGPVAKQTAGARGIWSRGTRLPLRKLNQRWVKAGETEAELNHFLLSDFFLFFIGKAPYGK